MDKVAGRSALGKLLAAHRAAAGWTQRRLAAEAFVDRSYIAHAESGRALPSRSFWTAADDALGAAGELVAAFDAVQCDGRTSERAADDDPAGMDPRSVAERSLSFADRAVVTNVSEETIDHLRWEVSRLAVAYVHADLGVVFIDLVATRDALFRLLEGRQRPRHTRDLYFLAGATCLLLAHASQNLGDERAALAQLRCSWTCIDQADHPELRTWAHGTAALIAEWSSQPGKAVSFAATGLRSATGAGRARLTAIRGRAAARAGDLSLARSSAAELQEMLDEPDGGDLGDLGGLLTFPRAKRHYYLGGTLNLVGTHDLARTHAARAVELYRTGPREARSYGDEALARLDITTACIVDGDLDGAAVALAPVLDLPVGRRIRQLDAAMTTTAAALTHGPKADDRVSTMLLDRIAGYRSAGHSRALSSGA
ncbi:helix-turn-helix domain-containing protein [Pseudonocardia hydrocarbonoxydans]|uniref:helix-turn-helix domain-containing protein n=1 Tax=Pseudonocardia hydrocarbonoxydans TaxID=76726 RepID=UPI0031DD5640